MWGLQCTSGWVQMCTPWKRIYRMEVSILLHNCKLLLFWDNTHVQCLSSEVAAASWVPDSVKAIMYTYIMPTAYSTS